MTSLKNIFKRKAEAPPLTFSDVTEFLGAIQKGNYKQFLNMIATFGEPLVNAQGLFGVTPLMQAAYSSGKDIDAFTPLTEDYVAVLLQAGAHVDAQDDSGKTALITATDFNRPHNFKSLLEAQANPNLQTIPQKATALHIAAQKRNFDFMSALLDAGADPYHRDNDRKTPAESVQGGNKLSVEIFFSLWEEEQRRKIEEKDMMMRERENAAFIKGISQDLIIPHGTMKLQRRRKKTP